MIINNYDPKFEKLKSDFEKGIVSIESLSDEEMKKLKEYYEKQVEINKINLENTKNKIRNLKKKIDDIV